MKKDDDSPLSGGGRLMSTLGVKRVSGPVSAHVFDLERPRLRLYVFGDQHHRWDNLCGQPCSSSQGCADILRFVRAAVREAEAGADDGRQLDVFLEMPYVVRGGPVRDRWIELIDRLMKNDPRTTEVFGRSSSRGSSGSRATAAAAKKTAAGPRRLWGLIGGGGGDDDDGDAPRRAAWRRDAFGQALGTSPKYIGVFSHLYREFREELYGEGRSEKSRTVRFHYCDARHEPHAAALLHRANVDPAEFHRRLRTSEQLREMLKAFLFARDFAAEMRRLLGDAEAAALLRPEALSEGMHKVAKQFHALDEDHVKAAVKRYLDDRIEDAISVVRDDLGFDSGFAASVAAPKDLPVHLEWLRMLREERGRLYTAFFPVAMLVVNLVVMDAYLVCRLARFCLQRKPKGGGEEAVGVVYVGDLHAEHYVAFLKDYVGARLTVCSKMTVSLKDGQPSRCVSLEPSGAADAACRTFGRAPMALPAPPTAATKITSGKKRSV